MTSDLFYASPQALARQQEQFRALRSQIDNYQNPYSGQMEAIIQQHADQQRAYCEYMASPDAQRYAQAAGGIVIDAEFEEIPAQPQIEHKP